MTTRVTALIVTLDEPVREDDVAGLVSAVLQLRGVQTVQTVESDPLQFAHEKMRATFKIREHLARLYEAIGKEDDRE